MKPRDRIKELRRVKGSEIPPNWRTHPKAQQDAMRDILADVGIAVVLLVQMTPAGLRLLDSRRRVNVPTDGQALLLVLKSREPGSRHTVGNRRSVGGDCHIIEIDSHLAAH